MREADGGGELDANGLEEARPGISTIPELKAPGNRGAELMPEGNTVARFYRSQSDITLINGNPDIGEWSTVDLNNHHGSGLSSRGFLSLIIDSDNGSTDQKFTIRKDGQSGEVLMSVGENNEVDINGSLTVSEELDMTGNVISNVADPIAAQDATTKAYVDSSDDVNDADHDPNNEFQDLTDVLSRGNNAAIHLSDIFFAPEALTCTLSLEVTLFQSKPSA